MGGNGLRLFQGRFRLDTKKHFFTERAVMPREVFKRHRCSTWGYGLVVNVAALG